MTEEEQPHTKRLKPDDNGATEMHIGEDVSSPNTKLVLSINRKLYLNEKTADVHFLFERDGTSDIERIPANKIILSTGSKVFETMFYGSMAEGDDVKISDVSPSAFREFLQFFYLDEVSLSVDNIADVINLVRKYGIERCMVQCTDFFKDAMTSEDACSAYQLAIQFDLDDLKHFCPQKISANAEAVLKSNGFLTCKRPLLQLIVGMDSLMCEEACVFDACMEWAKRSCEMNGMDPGESKNLRAQLGESVLYSIHFNRMPIEEFAPRNAKYVGLFTYPEITEILQLIACKGFKPNSFTASPVCYDSFTWDEKRSIKCSLDRLKNSNCLRKNQKTELVTLTCNKPILLHKIKFAKVYPTDISASFEKCTPSEVQLKIVQQKDQNEKWLIFQQFSR
ncbi:hypothetical protein HA402_005225 [Bradysia odoriphaga]|nr:hypothetical protein HA402_005225 [Bradysia odoriphaga]